ncbi:MAG: hypothetical protein AB7P97_05785 [Hyphomonadaceae bacterium]
MRLNAGPVRRIDHDHGDTPLRKVLLIAKILVRRDEDLESVALGRRKQRAILKLIPTAFERRFDIVRRKSLSERGWRALVKENLHIRRD